MHNKNCQAHQPIKHKGKVSYLESIERKAELSAEKLLSLIPVKESDSILDLGAGTGYFTIALAHQVTGPVYALDIDASMLEFLNAKAIQENATNIVPFLGEIADFPSPDTSIDVVLASLVLHEITPLAGTLNKVHHLLEDGGYLICMELEPKADLMHKAPRISSNEMEREIRDAGFQVIQKFFPTDSLYVLIAQK